MAVDKQTLGAAIGIIGAGGGSGIAGRVTAIENKIPAEASSTNKLADKAYVNDAIENNIGPAVSDWLDDNVDPETGYVLDYSLSIQGAAADAKATGDAVADLRSAINEQGIYDDNRIDKIEDNVFSFEQVSLGWVAGGFSPTGATQDNSARIRNNNFIIIIPGRIMKLASDTPDIKFKVLYYSSNAINTFVKMDSFFTNTSRIISNDTNSNFYIRILAGYTNDATVSTVSDVSSHIYMVKEVPYDYAEKSYVDGKTEVWVPFTDSYTGDAYWSVEGDTAVKTTLDSHWVAYDPISVYEGQEYEVTARQGNTAKTRIWIVTDDSLNIIAMADNYQSSSTVVSTERVTIPTGGTKLLVCSFWTNYVILKKKETAIDLALGKVLIGKKLSLLGDSISAFAGTIPEGNDAYYTGSNSGVRSADQMWWSVLCSLTGLVPLIINGWSGSGVTQLEDSAHVDKVPMSSDTRCSALDDGTNNPDIILIAGGVNDYTYAESAQSEPLEWDGKTTPVLSDSFTEAYACMIKKLQTNYPNAIVVALSTWFTMRGTDNGYTLTHTVGSNVYTQQDYNDKIRYVAEQMHIPYIDVSNIGINRNNMYPTYAQDSSSIPTHPNANGQALMGRAIAGKLIELVKAYLS